MPKGLVLDPTKTKPPALLEAFRRLNAEKDFSRLAALILEEACGLFQAQAAGLLLVNKNTGEVELAAVKNVPQENLDAYRRAPVRAGQLEAWVGRDADGPAAGGGSLDLLASAGLSQAGWFPIRLLGKTIGCLTLASSHRLLPTAGLKTSLDLFLEYLAQAIENAYWIYQLRQQNAQAEIMLARLQNTQTHLKRAEKLALVGKISTLLAHEIRNPLNVIGTSLQWLFDQGKQDPADASLFKTMIEKVRALDQILKEMLAFSRPMQFHPQAVDVERALKTVIAFVGKKYQARRLEIVQNFSAPLPRVWADEEQLQRVLLNLFLNAGEILPEQGKVEVLARHREGETWVTMTIRDNGPGIPAENLAQIFEPFFSTRPEGTGLGLFLVKYILEEMGGEIEARGAVPQGAEFLLRLPMAPAPEDEQ